MPFGKAKGQPNCSPSSITETCNTSHVLTAYNFPGWSYSWAETNAGGGSQIPINGGAPSSTITVAPNQTTNDEIHYYLELGHNQYAPFNNCISGVRVVKFCFQLHISSNNNSSPTCSISGTSITYNSYQWNKNGNPILNAISSTYAPTTSGSYTLSARNSCGNTLTSNPIIYNAPNNQCSSSAPIYNTCNATYNLSFTPASGYSVYWYKCDANGGNASILNGGNATTSLNVSPNSNTSQESYYYYTCIDNYSLVPCNSGIITVVFEKDLPIVSNSSTLAATLSYNKSSNNSISYTNYQWYRNGQQILGATSNSYNATLPGDYYMTCTSISCGNSTSNTITFCGTNSYATNYSFTGTHTYSYTTIILDGNITIATGANITFDHVNLYMKGCAGITVKSNGSGVGKLTITNSIISGCALWSGIVVEGTYSGELTINNTLIRDATIGIYADVNAALDIQNCLFEDNLTHLVLYQFAGGGSTFSNNEFSYLKSAITGCNNVPNVHSLLNSTTRRMVLLDNCISVKFSTCQFYPNDIFNTADIDGIEAYDCAVPLGGPPVTTLAVWINHCEFNGVFRNGAYFDNCRKVTIDGIFSNNNLVGDFNYALNFKQSSVIKILDQKFNFTGSSNSGKAAIKCYQSSEVKILGNIINAFGNGIEYYSNSTGNQSSAIGLNHIEGTNIGIVLAPEEYPVGSAHSQSSSTVNKMTDFPIYCNKMYYNDYAIVGYGDMDDQPFNGVGPDWGNWFAAPGSGGASNSTSTFADIVYLSSTGVNGNKPTIVHYIAGNNALLKLFTSTNNYTLSIEGCSVAYNGSYKITDQLTFGTNSNSPLSCWNTYSYKTDPVGFAKGYNIAPEFEIYPNPFADYINLGNNNNGPISYIIYNQLGEIIKQGLLKSAGTESLNMSNMVNGCYYIKIYKTGNNESLYSRKLIKTN